MSSISVVNDKLLSEKEWESIFGTTMYEKMLINRFVIRNITNVSLFHEIPEWMRLNCNSFYFHFISDYLRIYILDDTDAVNFKMRWDGHEEDDVIASTCPITKALVQLAGYN